MQISFALSYMAPRGRYGPKYVKSPGRVARGKALADSDASKQWRAEVKTAWLELGKVGGLKAAMKRASNKRKGNYVFSKPVAPMRNMG